MHQAVYILHLAKAARSDDSVYAKVIAQETTHKNKKNKYNINMNEHVSKLVNPFENL
jgi:hypothetical protein